MEDLERDPKGSGHAPEAEPSGLGATPACPSRTLSDLSSKATPGPWKHIVGDDYYIESASYPPKATHNSCVIDSGWWLAVGNRPDDFGEANSLFIVALVNAYRSGKLVEAEVNDSTDPCGCRIGDCVKYTRACREDAKP